MAQRLYAIQGGGGAVLHNLKTQKNTCRQHFCVLGMRWHLMEMSFTTNNT